MNNLKEIIFFLEKEAKSCEWYGQGILLEKVKKATSTAKELFDKAETFRNIIKYIKTLEIKENKEDEK